MPVAVSYPGVYIQEISSGVHTITSVSTSIGAFFGRASQGPMNQAVHLLSPADFPRNFGAPHPQSDLAASVNQFFANGGTECYVVRVARNASKASVILEDLHGEQVLVATAKADGVWANTVRLEIDYNTVSPAESFNLRVIQEQGGAAVATESYLNLSMNPLSPRFAPSFVSQGSALIELKLDALTMGDPTLPGSFFNAPSIDLGVNAPTNSFAGFSQGRRQVADTGAAIDTAMSTLVAAGSTTFEISVNDGPWASVSLGPWAPVSNTLANIEAFVQGQINNALGALAPSASVIAKFPVVIDTHRVLVITADSGNKSSVRVRRAAANDIAAALMLGTDQGGIEATRWSNFRPAPTATLLRLGDPATPGDFSASNTATVNALSALLQSDITKLTIEGTDVPLNAGASNLVTTVGGDEWFLNKAGASTATGDNDGVREKLRITAAAINATATLNWRAEVWGYQLALLAKSGAVNVQPGTVTATGPGAATFTGGLIKNVRQYTLGTGGTGPFSVNGTDGSDGIAPTASEYLGNPVDQTGFHALDQVDLFNLMVVPGDAEVDEATVMSSVWGPASNYCKSRRAFLLIDAPKNWTQNNGRPAVTGNTQLINDLRVSLVKDYSAVFYPRLTYNNNGLIANIGASGAIAGLMARTDADRGVWKAPAGIEATIQNVLGVDVKLTDMENGVLNKKGVNCLRVFPTGLVNWGGRTLDGDDDIGSEWKYIPIRRLALMIEESLFRGTKWVVFEPNDEPLWAKIRLNVNAYMMSLFRQGAFQGSAPKDAFFVRCDASTTTQNDRNLGIVNIQVGFAPLKPAEFVVITIQQIAGDL
jgi:phage tail sheath protein FI